MKIWRMLIAVPIVLLANQALAENWVTVFNDEDEGVVTVDKDSIHRGSDGLVYFMDHRDLDREDMAVDCQGRIAYLLKIYDVMSWSDWRKRGDAIVAGSPDDAELQYVCANAG